MAMQCDQDWLYNIIRDGRLVDNEYYRISGGILTNRNQTQRIQLNTRKQGEWNRTYNNDCEIWSFLNTVACDTEKALSNSNSEAIVLFNDKEYEHNTSDSFILLAGSKASSFTLRTGNLIGFIKCSDYSLKISSRFGDAFLRYIIADADGFLELENFGGEKNFDDGYKWLLAYLWNINLKRAYRLGLPKSYISKRDKTSRPRGIIDAIDYFKNSMTGKVSCSYREHSYDGPANSLFIKAYEKVKDYPFSHSSRNAYNAFLAASQGINRTHLEILQTRNFLNPYYSDYNNLIYLSKKIITQSDSDFGVQNDSSAFLFDVSMLFEYFIRKLIKRGGIRLLSKSEKRHEIPTAGEYKRNLEPDVVLENEDGFYVFDVKYKRFDFKRGVKREDLFQLHTYIGQFGNNEAAVRGCGFIYPLPANHVEAQFGGKSYALIWDFIRQHGRRIPFYVLFLIIPENGSSSFAVNMRENCRRFLETIQSCILRSS